MNYLTQNLSERSKKAGILAKWLIEDKGRTRKIAYIIATHKYKIPSVDLVRQEYLKIQRTQQPLF